MHPFPLCKLPAIPLNGRFLRFCKQGTLQFVIVKPVTAILSLIMLAAGKYDDIVYQWFLFIVYNISYSWALYVLYLFYQATKDLLRDFKPVQKFFAVKLVVFMTYWQSLGVAVVPGISEPARWNDFILCIEMLVFALLHLSAFGAGEFRSSFEHSVVDNMGSVLSVRDVVHDTVHNFKPIYRVCARHVHEYHHIVPSLSYCHAVIIGLCIAR